MLWIKEYMDYAVFSVLGLMSFLALAYAIERWLYYRSCKIETYKDINILEIDLTKNLTILYIIYSNAPYVGLLGTVIGIMVTFFDMGNGSGIEANSILVGLSMALKATALGLLVAIPTLGIYSAYLRRVDVFLNKWKSVNATS